MLHWSLIARTWWAIPVIGLVLWGARVDSLRTKYKAERDAVTTEYAQYQAGVKAASNAAREAQIAQIASIEKSYQEKARASENEVHRIRGDYRASVMRYAASNGRSCGSIAAAESSGSGVSQSGASEAQLPERITITLDDALLTADLYAYALAAHHWAKGLE